MDNTETQEGATPDFNPLGTEMAEDTRPCALVPVRVDKTLERGDIEYSHVSGTHGLAMWLPTSELAELPEADNSELKDKLKATDQANKDLQSQLDKSLKAAPETKEVKKPDESK